MSYNNQQKNIEISQQQLSIIAASLLILTFFIFMAGFFWGKKSVLLVSHSELTSPSFADTLYTVFDTVRDTKFDVEMKQIPMRTNTELAEHISVNGATQIQEIMSKQTLLEKKGE